MGTEISLLIPCYNAGRYLPRLADSIKAQTVPFAEILCYDDGSTDDTRVVAERLGLPIIGGSANRGPAFARNRLWEAATFDWVHFHDADDLLAPRFVEKMSTLLDADTDVAVCQMDWLWEDSRRLQIAWRYNQEQLARDPLAANLVNPIGVIACVVRRESLRQVGGFDESLPTWEDADLQVRLAQNGARYRVHSEVLAIGLRHGVGASRDPRVLAECRLRLLLNYERALPPACIQAIAAQAERLAGDLSADGVSPDLVDQCLALCRRHRWPVPTSRSLFIRMLRNVVPRRRLLAWQSRFRRWRAARR